MAAPERDELTGTETTRHEWDGIQELDTPLPRWWLWSFYITIIWAIAYTIAYPAWPLITTATQGVLGYSSRAAVAETIRETEAARAGMIQKVAATDFAAIAADNELDSFAKSGGAAVFRTNCAQCHGAGGGGAKGYPNLVDNAWIWGGDPEDIATTVRHGIRWEADDDTRISEMPAFGDDGILSKDEIAQVAQHVLSLSDRAEKTGDGATLYEENCAACHGDEGKGMTEMGAPNLADAIWLYGGDMETVIATITHSRAGVMPAWSDRLTEAEIKQVAYYVYTLGGGN